MHIYLLQLSCDFLSTEARRKVGRELVRKRRTEVVRGGGKIRERERERIKMYAYIHMHTYI